MKKITLKPKDGVDFMMKQIENEQYIIDKVKSLEEEETGIVGYLNNNPDVTLEDRCAKLGRLGDIDVIKAVYTDLYEYMQKDAWDKIEEEIPDEVTESESKSEADTVETKSCND